MRRKLGIRGAAALLAFALGVAPSAPFAEELQVKVGNRELSVQEGLPKDKRNIAVLVCDPRDAGRYAPTETMMIATVDTRTGDAYMTVLQPGLLVEIPMVGLAPLSQAYALGGENLVMKTLNEVFGLNIRDYVCIDLRRFSAVVETVGGIAMTLGAEEAAALGLPAGAEVTMNLDQTLEFMRLPKDDPYTDRRYDVVMRALYQGTRDRDALKLTGLLQKSLASIDTNIGFFDLAGLGAKVIGSNVRLERRLPAAEDLTPADGPQSSLYTADMGALREAVHAFLYGLAD